MNNLILLKNNYISSDFFNNKKPDFIAENFNFDKATILSNMYYYGYAPSNDLIFYINSLNHDELKNFWLDLYPVFEVLTGNNLRMSDFVVYKNFPSEVLNKNELEQFYEQFLSYFLNDNSWFTQDKIDRDLSFSDFKNLKVLNISNENTFYDIFLNLCSSSSKWSFNEKETITFLLNIIDTRKIQSSCFYFKENLLFTLSLIIKNNYDNSIKLNTCKDVLRLASILSDDNFRFKNFINFNRKTRQLLLSYLENIENLEIDAAENKESIKKLFTKLRVGDYKNKYPRCLNIFDQIYNKKINSYNSKIEKMISVFSQFKLKDTNNNKLFPLKSLDYNFENLLNLIKIKPGLFIKKFHKLYSINSDETILSLISCINNVNTLSLLKFQNYINNINNTDYLFYKPNSNYLNLIKSKNNKPKIKELDISLINTKINSIIQSRLQEKHPEGFKVDPILKNIKIQSNNQEISEFTIGSVIKIPDNTTFIRTGSYWKTLNIDSNIWFDNSINYFDKNFKPIGHCAWDKIKFKKQKQIGSIFSGDPLISSNENLAGAQFIDLYLEPLVNLNVRYCVWSILSFNDIYFDEIEEIFATIQFGNEPLKGEIYEPSRSHISHKLKGHNLSKVFLCLDLLKREIIIIDNCFKLKTQSASLNAEILSSFIPTYIDNCSFIPSYFDLLSKHEGSIISTYDDNEIDIKEKGLVINKTNTNNNFINIEINDLLN